MANEKPISTKTLSLARRLVEKLRDPKHGQLLQGLDDLHFDVDRAVASTEVLLKKIDRGNVLRFDPYLRSGFKPNENSFSDVLSAILNPRGGHNLGLTGINALLAAAKPMASLSGRKTIAQIGKLLRNHSDVRIRVLREYHYEGGRVDIRLIGPKFEIILENKLRGTSEVFISEKYQTERYEAMCRQAEDGGSHVLAIFLTPEGRSAANKRFIPVSCAGFAHFLLEELSTLPKNAELRSAIIMLEAFAATYEWLN